MRSPISPDPGSPTAPADLPPLDSRVVTYYVVDEKTRRRVRPSIANAAATRGFRVRDLDGDALAWRVMRQRWIG